VGLRTGGQRAKGLKNRVKSSKIELRFREVRLESSPSRSAVQQEINFIQKLQIPGNSRFPGIFLFPKVTIAFYI